jgi:hypothetical protein
MAERAHRLVAERFSVDTMIAATLDAYRPGA